MFKHSLPSIEKFAAFLDGNLSQSEMQQFSQMLEHNNALHQLSDASTLVDNTLAGYSDSDLQLPPEIVGSDFALPTIPTEDISPLVTLTPEPMDDTLVAAAANIVDNMQDIGNMQENNYDCHDDSFGLGNSNSQILDIDDGIGSLQDTILFTDNPE